MSRPPPFPGAFLIGFILRIISQVWYSNFLHRDENPGGLIMRALLNPPPQQFLFFVVQTEVAGRRRHAVVIVGGGDAAIQFALFRMARDDGFRASLLVANRIGAFS